MEDPQHKKIITALQQSEQRDEYIVDLLMQVLQKKSFIEKQFSRLSPRLTLAIPKLSPPRFLEVPEYYHDVLPLAHPPRISIVTPSFRQAIFLESTIKSVLTQRYPNLEYIIQDGGSMDGSVDIIRRYEAQLAHWESKPDGGQSQAINLGFAHATGDIMAYLNSDDLLLPGALNYIAHYFEQHPEVDVVYGHRVLIDAKGREIGRWILPRHANSVLKWVDYIPQETLFWRRSIWEKAGGKIDEDFRFAMDWDLILRFLKVGARFKRLPRFLGAFRVHQTQKTLADINETGFLEMKKLRYRCHGRSVGRMEIKRHMASYLLQHVILHNLYRLGWVKY